MADIKYLNNCLKNNRHITIYIGASRHDRSWKNNRTTWSAFANRLRTPVVSSETLEEYERLPKARQGELKDVGGFVGGEFEGNRRAANNLKTRDLICLDLDNIPAGELEKILKKLFSAGCAFVAYSTRSHRPDRPRLRVIIPTDRPVTPDEYEPLARITAQKTGVLQYCDPTTFQANRLMYFPSCSSNSEFVFEINDAPFLCAAGVLESVENWKDVEAWPTLPDERIRFLKMAKQQASPVTKAGIVGTFCRAYDISEAIEEFLPDLYTEAGPNRYTYAKGTTTGGAVLYGDGLFLFSHHATDPCCGRLTNAFDLVRIHLFGDLDGKMEPDTPEHKTPSFASMVKRILDDPKVCALQAEEKRDHVREVFQAEPEPTENTAWTKLLSYKKDGTAKASVENIVTILTHDPALKGKIAIDEFTARLTVTGSLPWNNESKIRGWTDTDDSNLYLYLESGYQIAGQANMLKAVNIISFRNRYNSVEQYLNSLIWDETPRVDTLLADYLGADRNEYTAQVMWVSLVSAIGRAVIGGTKFDYVPILVGAQGIGKSTFLARLGKQWFSDSLQTFEGKDASELLQGVWINELPELSAFGRSETNKIKQFISKTEDFFRVAYGRRAEKYPRRCVFFGSTNDDEFLKDVTGNRRYWPVRLGKYEPVKSVFNDLTVSEVDQVWAEAMAMYKVGALTPHLIGQAADAARKEQRRHEVTDEWSGLIEKYLETPVPEDWADLDLSKRRMFLSGNTDVEPTGRIDRVCAAEIWCECFGKDAASLSNRDSIRICNALRRLPGWASSTSIRTSYCGRQRGYVRIDQALC
jgi:predicted P-loop ATPase